MGSAVEEPGARTVSELIFETNPQKKCWEMGVSVEASME